MKNPKLNGSGYRDMTAYEALKNVYKAPDDLGFCLVKTLKQVTDMANVCGFELIGKVVIKHKATGKEYR